MVALSLFASSVAVCTPHSRSRSDAGPFPKLRFESRRPRWSQNVVIVVSVRLADFILANVEPILVEWESFARGIWPKGAQADPVEVRDEAEDILRATAVDMQSSQTDAEQAEKSKGARRLWDERGDLTRASSSHGTGRVASGFDLWVVVAEYRALRASVLRLWRESGPAPDLRDVDDLTRFNESMDQSLTHAIRGYAEQVDRDREALLANEQASRREAEAANRAKDVFLATLSHEMRTPLNAIVGWLSILRHEDAETKHFQEGLKVIERNTMAQVQLHRRRLGRVANRLRQTAHRHPGLPIGRRDQRRCQPGADGGGRAGYHLKRAARSGGKRRLV